MNYKSTKSHYCSGTGEGSFWVCVCTTYFMFPIDDDLMKFAKKPTTKNRKLVSDLFLLFLSI